MGSLHGRVAAGEEGRRRIYLRRGLCGHTDHSSLVRREHSVSSLLQVVLTLNSSRGVPRSGRVEALYFGNHLRPVAGVKEVAGSLGSLLEVKATVYSHAREEGVDSHSHTVDPWEDSERNHTEGNLGEGGDNREAAECGR